MAITMLMSTASDTSAMPRYMTREGSRSASRTLRAVIRSYNRLFSKHLYIRTWHHLVQSFRVQVLQES